MPSEIKKIKAVEKSTFVITATFLDTNKRLVAPSSMVWSLVESDGTVVNSRTEVSISSPSSEEEITLSGDDLAINDTSNAQEERYLVLEGAYTDGGGVSRPLNDQVKFYIQNIKKVS